MLSLHCELSVLGKSMVGQQTWREPEFACKRNLFDNAMESERNYKEYHWNFPRIRKYSSTCIAKSGCLRPCIPNNPILHLLPDPPGQVPRVPLPSKVGNQVDEDADEIVVGGAPLNGVDDNDIIPVVLMNQVQIKLLSMMMIMKLKLVQLKILTCLLLRVMEKMLVW